MKRALVMSVIAAFLLAPTVLAETIYQIQYNDTMETPGCWPSQLDGTTVTGVAGIVTAVQQGTYDNFYIQDPIGTVYHGLYTYDTSVNCAVGDSVSLDGAVAEYYGLTQLTSITDFTIHSSGNTVPAPVYVTTALVGQGCDSTIEKYEGVLVKLYNVTVLHTPEGNGNFWVSDNPGDSCYCDDNLYKYGSGPATAPDSGVVYDSLVGIVHYEYDEYEVWPRDGDDFYAPEPLTIPIYDVQYTTVIGGTPPDTCYPSPENGNYVTIEGVVTGVQAGTYPDFYLQDADSLWSGVYIFDDIIDPAIGDWLIITGQAVEYYGLTEITNLTFDSLVSSANPLPANQSLTTAFIGGGCDANTEAYEGMLVELTDVTVLTDQDGNGVNWVQDASGDSCMIDDDLYRYGTPPDPVPAKGMLYNSIVGILHYKYGDYRVMVRDGSDLDLGSALLCETTVYSQYVPCEEGTMYFDVEVTNVSGAPYSTVVVEIRPTLGDCATGFALDYNIHRTMTTNLGAGESYTGYYYFYTGDDRCALGPYVALTVEVGAALNDYQATDCDEFYFFEPFGRPSPNISWDNAEFGERGDIGINIPTVTALGQNYPNPFNAETVIPFDLASNGNVSLKVYNLAGQLVETLVDGEMNAGRHTWDASTVSSGVYFYKLQVNDLVTTKKMNLLK